MASRLLTWRSWKFWLGLVLLTIVLAGLGVWIFRKPVAVSLAKNWCRSQALTCELSVSGLSLGRASVDGLKISSASGEIPFEAEHAQIELSWPGLFTPRIDLVELSGPIVRGRYGADGSTSFGGLEKLGGGGGGSGELPQVRIEDARIELATPAGPLAMTGRLSGQLPFQAELHAEIEPAELQTGDNRLVLRKGVVDLSLVGVKIDGDAEFDLAEARFETVSAQDIRLTASMADSLRPTVNWTAEIGLLARAGLRLDMAKLDGNLSLAIAKKDADDGLIGRIQSAALSGTADALQWQDITSGTLSVTMNASRTTPTAMSVDYALKAAGLSRTEMRAEKTTLSGSAEISNDLSDIRADGDLVVEGASLPEDFRRSLLSGLVSGPPMDAHLAALRSGLGKALANFSTGAGFSFRQPKGGGWSLVTTTALNAKSANGAALGIEPHDTRPAINIADDTIEASGVVTLAGPGMPKLAADLELAHIAGGDIRAEAGGVALAPWRVDGLSIAATLNELNFERIEGQPRVQTVGEMRLDGPLYGMTFAETRLFGGVDAVLGTGLRVQTYKTKCLGLDTDGIHSDSGLEIDAVKLQLCPRDGRVVRRSGKDVVGTVDVDDIALPFTSTDTSGVLTLDDAVLDWSAGQRVRLDATANRMGLPLTIGEKTLQISAASPKLGFISTKPATLTAAIGATEFAGSLVPADINVERVDFSAKLAPSGLEGTAKAYRVEVRDRAEDPLYVPLIGDLSAEFGDGLMTLSGPITTATAGRTIADVSMSLNLVTLDGEASITSQELAFTPRGFQPTALSDRVRGFLSNARGLMTASATIELDGGTPSGTGWVDVRDFGFDTVRVGAVNGVNGRIEFSDILSLTTPPGQEVQLGEINPGIPLKDGLIVFQLTNGREAVIERARWPFAGGELVVGRTEWTIAGTSDIIPIRANAIELTELIGIFKLPDVQAKGTVSGDFPVEIVGPNAFIRNATLQADEDGGTIAYNGDVADAASQADDRVSMAFNALRDFRFTVLQLGADGNLSGDILITLRLVGNSPKVMNGAPFAFNIGLDSKLMKLIRAGQSLSSSDWLTEAVKESTEVEETGDAPE